MIEKIGHIKNPLTVVAIFAALAEVSGTVVLPLLKSDIQKTYVWFLMCFPIFLVAIFFFVLYKKHHVLYAPTDFKDDKTFKELFENASSSEKVAKIKNEQEEPVVNAPDSVTETPPKSSTEDTTPISAAKTLRRSFQGNALLAEELVIAKLSKDMRLRFERNLTVKGETRLVFDAVATVANHAVVAEVRFTRVGLFTEATLTEYFERVKRFSESLPEDLKRNIEFVFAVATDSEEPAILKRIEHTGDRIRAISERFPFKTIVRIFNMQDLEREFAVQ